MSETYERDSFFLAYLKWHYRQGLNEMIGVVRNFLWFIYHFFSFKLLLRTLFSPWKRLGEKYSGGLDLGALASTIIVNLLMRAVGFATRAVVLAVGAASYAVALALSVAILAIWVLAPLILISSAVLSATFFVI